MMKPAECKLEDGNNCPDADSFLAEFEGASPVINLQFVDVDEGSWENDSSTAVLTFNYDEPLSAERWANFMALVHDLHPDDVEWRYAGDTPETERIVFRLWWD
jgi:hypothetical protein